MIINNEINTSPFPGIFYPSVARCCVRFFDGFYWSIGKHKYDKTCHRQE